MYLIRNERLKLFATYLNGLGIAVFAVGGLAPVLSMLNGTLPASSTVIVAIVGTICFLVSAALHYAGSLVVKGLRQ